MSSSSDYENQPITSNSNADNRRHRGREAKLAMLGLFHSLMHWSDISRMWKSNRRVFRRVVNEVAGPGVVTKRESDKLYNVFTTYFLDQALHHEKAKKAHRFDMNIKVARHPDSLIRYNFFARKRDRKRRKFVKEMNLDPRYRMNASDNYHSYNPDSNARVVYDRARDSGSSSPQSHERLVASDEIFFHRCRDYLGERLSNYLHDVMKNVKIEFMAVQYTDTRQKAWANWEWVGALYIPRSQSANLEPTPSAATRDSPPQPAHSHSHAQSHPHSQSKMQALKTKINPRKKGGKDKDKQQRRSSYSPSTNPSPPSSSPVVSEEDVIYRREYQFPDTREATEERRRQERQNEDYRQSQHVV